MWKCLYLYLHVYRVRGNIYVFQKRQKNKNIFLFFKLIGSSEVHKDYTTYGIAVDIVFGSENGINYEAM